MARKTKTIDYDEEIRDCDEKIAKLRSRKAKLERQKTEAENDKIITIVRQSNMTVDALGELISAFSNEKPERKNENETD